MVFLKDFFENINFEKNQQTAKKHSKLPSMQIVRRLVADVTPCAHVIKRLWISWLSYLLIRPFFVEKIIIFLMSISINLYPAIFFPDNVICILRLLHIQ